MTMFKVVTVKRCGLLMYTVKFRQSFGFFWHPTCKEFYTIEQAFEYKNALRKLDLGLSV